MKLTKTQEQYLTELWQNGMDNDLFEEISLDKIKAKRAERLEYLENKKLSRSNY
ncbi:MULTISPECIES: hypothetical protein [Lonepinella]|uniref:Uncharacterized protein n=1 Tax=Lonepinella koalarum TaxID=53417 RepID=A0A4R1KZG8_9PAST|nr:hypothetical protein [Lonepinella koalarum]TCK70985.1 hypothetical protein EV692_0036 [Lonepinella koalarum]